MLFENPIPLKLLQPQMLKYVANVFLGIMAAYIYIKSENYDTHTFYP